jgi:hypothetical protein
MNRLRRTSDVDTTLLGCWTGGEVKIAWESLGYGLPPAGLVRR